MSILDLEKLDKDLDRYVLEVFPKVEDFKKCFRQGVSCPVMEDAQTEVNMTEVAKELSAGYFDLSTATDYNLLTRAIKLWPDGLIFDNIDRIPESEDKEYIKELVRFALKKEMDFPLPDNQMIDFSKINIGARCTEYPEYLEGKSLSVYIIVI